MRSRCRLLACLSPFILSKRTVLWTFVACLLGPAGPLSAAGGKDNKASNPNPADGATGVDTKVVLSWTPGASAMTHSVYFGTSRDDVSNWV